MEFLFALVVAFACFQVALSGDPNILSDFIVPTNLTIVNGTFFTYTGMRALLNSSEPSTFKVTKASLAEFPALDGQSVSFAVLQYPADSINPPHTHPRSAELLFLLSGTLEVGFVDTTNKLFSKVIQTGDMFVFPKGLVHYQYNSDAKNYAVAVSAFGSSSAGTVSVPTSVFTTGIYEGVLAKSFNTDVKTIEKIKAGLSQKS
ncbi:Cupin 1 [Dillenia turbinata]|uniref:Germin-like protein n=1 Tax=Dillenia turbinata TaxID=194707 RepID=A0AAN8VHA7_9MAGN